MAHGLYNNYDGMMVTLLPLGRLPSMFVGRFWCWPVAVFAWWHAMVDFSACNQMAAHWPCYTATATGPGP